MGLGFLQERCYLSTKYWCYVCTCIAYIISQNFTDKKQVFTIVSSKAKAAIPEGASFVKKTMASGVLIPSLLPVTMSEGWWGGQVERT